MDISVMLWSESAILPVLTMMTLLPLATLLTVLLVDSPKFSGFLGYLGTSTTGLLAAYLLIVYDSDNTGIQLAEHASFAGMHYSVGVDGANILYIALTTVITLLCLIYVQGSRYAHDAYVIAAILGYETILIGAFSALNGMQFWLWCALEVIPVGFLTMHTGTGHQRKKALTVLLQFWGGGLLLSFIGFILLGFGMEDTEQAINFDWLILAQNNAPFMNESLIFILLFYGFAVRMPLFPFHAWLPLLAEQGSLVAGGVFVVGLKLGLYAFIRFVLPLVPGVAEEWSFLVVIMGLLSIFYGAIMAFMQINARRILAFAVISQMGILAIGSITFEVSGVEGSILLSLAFGLAAAGLLFCIGFIYERTQTLVLPRLGGLFDHNITLGLLFLISVLSTIAMPGTPGFQAAHLLIDGVVGKNGWVIALVIGIGNFLSAAFLLWTFQRIFLMEAKRSLNNHTAHTLLIQEQAITLIICCVLIFTGFYSGPWQTMVETATGTIGKYYSIHNSIYEEENSTTYEIDRTEPSDDSQDDEHHKPEQQSEPDFEIEPNNHSKTAPNSGKIEHKPDSFSIEDV